MSETAKIVTEGFPVDDLTEAVRRVRVTVKAATSDVAPVSKRSLLELLGAARGLYASPEDAVAHIRGLRDESDR